MIHAYKLNGYNIILDQNSGCVHSVDPVAYDMITMYQDHDKEEIRRFILEKYKDQPDVTNADIDLCFEDIEALIADGRLFAEDTFEAVADQFKRRQGVLKAICLHVAHDCNLACKYCFAGKGEYDGQREIMSYEVGKQALDYLIANSPGRRNLEVDFFGGEPLLNWDVCKWLVAYGREQEKLHNKNFRFTLTTNGLLINDDVIDFSNREMGNVVLSLDGRKVTHDRLRVGRNGKGSYDLILDKSSGLQTPEGKRTTICGAPIPTSIRTLPPMCCTWRIWDLRSCLLSRWCAILRRTMPCRRATCLCFWSNTRYWPRKCCTVIARATALLFTTI